METTLDEVVLNNTLGPLLDVESSGVLKTAELPTLRRVVGRWLAAGSGSAWTAQVEGGTAWFGVGAHMDGAPEMGVRVTPSSGFATFSQGEKAYSSASAVGVGPLPLGRGKGEGPWSFEVGSILPHELSAGFESVAQAAGNGEFNARVKSSYEVHAAAIYALPHGEQNWAAPELGLGVSMLEVVDQVYGTFTYSGSFQSGGGSYPYSYQETQTQNVTRYSFCPLARLGVTLFPRSLVSVPRERSLCGSMGIRRRRSRGRRLIWGWRE